MVIINTHIDLCFVNSPHVLSAAELSSTTDKAFRIRGLDFKQDLSPDAGGSTDDNVHFVRILGRFT